MGNGKGFSGVHTLQDFVFADNASFDGTGRGGGLTTNGQLWIGHTTADRPDDSGHVKVGQLVSPNNSILFSYSSPNITAVIAGGSVVFTWNDVSGAFSPLKSNGYFVTGTATGTLPAAPSQGDTIEFLVDHVTQDLTITASGTQLIRFGSVVSSAGGTALSGAQGDSVTLVYRAADTCWCATSIIGTWILA